MELQLCSFLAMGSARLGDDEACEAWLERLFAAIPVGKAEDVTTTPYWVNVGQCISGEQSKKDGVSYTTPQTWLNMIHACEGSAWTGRNQIRFLQARRGEGEVPCGMCKRPADGMARDLGMESHEILPCRHVAHVSCLPVGYERARVPGYVAPGQGG
jgi:hypothetical protein